MLNWNLFNGGSDQARVRQYANLINQAGDQRDKACRDVRQTAAIAFFDIGRLKEQQAALEKNVAAIEKARDAYRQQFDIGQRSLLDLLNSRTSSTPHAARSSTPSTTSVSPMSARTRPPARCCRLWA